MVTETRNPFIDLIEAPDLATKIVAKDGSDDAGYVTVEDVLDVPVTATGGITARSLADRFGDQLNVKDFGAVGDGVTDDRAAIAEAVVAARGENLYFPEGQYVIDTDGGSITLEEIGLIGASVQDGANATVDQGSVIHVIGTVNSPFLIRRGVTVRSLGFYYPDQIDDATPVVYPPTLDFDFSNGAVQFVYIEENVAFNAFRFVRMDNAAGNVGHVWIENNSIYGIFRCIEITKNLEVIKIRGNTFTFGLWINATDAGVRSYTRANGVALQYDQGDGIWFTDNLIFGYFRGIVISGGQTILTTIANNSFDQVLNPIYAIGPGNFQQSHITGNIFLAFNGADTSQDGVAIYLNMTDTGDSFSITGNYFGTCTESHIVVDGAAGGKLVISGNTFESMAYNKVAGTHGALVLNCANKSIIFNGNYVQGNSNAYSYGIVCFTASVLHLGQNVFSACTYPFSVAAAGQITATGNASYATVGGVSENIVSVTNEIWQTGNRWDKPSGSSTKPAFLVHKNASQTFNSGTPTDVVWGLETIDKGGDFASPSFTAPYTGRYRFSWSLFHDNTGTLGERWTINLVATPGNLGVSYLMFADFNTVSGGGMLQLSAGDTVKLQVTREAGAGNFVTFNESSYNYFCGEWIE